MKRAAQAIARQERQSRRRRRRAPPPPTVAAAPPQSWPPASVRVPPCACARDAAAGDRACRTRRRLVRHLSHDVLSATTLVVGACTALRCLVRAVPELVLQAECDAHAFAQALHGAVPTLPATATFDAPRAPLVQHYVAHVGVRRAAALPLDEAALVWYGAMCALSAVCACAVPRDTLSRHIDAYARDVRAASNEAARTSRATYDGTRALRDDAFAHRLAEWRTACYLARRTLCTRARDGACRGVGAVAWLRDALDDWAHHCTTYVTRCERARRAAAHNATARDTAHAAARDVYAAHVRGVVAHAAACAAIEAAQ